MKFLRAIRNPYTTQTKVAVPVPIIVDADEGGRMLVVAESGEPVYVHLANIRLQPMNSIGYYPSWSYVFENWDGEAPVPPPPPSRGATIR